MTYNIPFFHTTYLGKLIEAEIQEMPGYLEPSKIYADLYADGTRDKRLEEFLNNPRSGYYEDAMIIKLYMQVNKPIEESFKSFDYLLNDSDYNTLEDIGNEGVDSDLKEALSTTESRRTDEQNDLMKKKT